MLSKTYAAALHGVDARTIEVEVTTGAEAAPGSNMYNLVGLPDNAIREGWQRMESALKSIGMRLPRVRIVANLAPADLRKEGARYDLPIATAIAASTGLIPDFELDSYMMIGELALDGSIRPVKGVLPTALRALAEGNKKLIVPALNVREAAIVHGIKVFGASSLRDVFNHLTGEEIMEPISINPSILFAPTIDSHGFDFTDVKGQENIKRALEIAAAGGHNVILIGPPGAGKTMLSKRMPSILPPLSIAEALVIADVLPCYVFFWR